MKRITQIEEVSYGRVLRGVSGYRMKCQEAGQQSTVRGSVICVVVKHY